MELTFSTDCADPRDRLLGVLDVVNKASEPGLRGLDPDYSLSAQHVSTGLFAHMHIHMKRWHLPAYGSGVFASPSTPSWVPDWTSWKNWRAVFKRRDRWFAGQRLEPLVREMWRIGAARSAPHLAQFVLALLPSKYGAAACFHEHKSLCVDPRTGGLRVGMVRFLALRSVPRLVCELQDESLMAFEVRCGQHLLCLSCSQRLDLIVRPETDWLCLYVIEEHSVIPGIHILRRGSAASATVARIVASCEVALFCLTSTESPHPHPSQKYSNPINVHYQRVDHISERITFKIHI
ncbi:hypothetical protein VTI74DRAFT_709 [Chaetomium olivicolor]